MGTPTNIFISHYGKHDDYLHRMKDRLYDRGFHVRNYSIDSTNHKGGRIPTEQVVRRMLRMRMRMSSTVVVLIGPETHTRPWVNWEIEEAHKAGKQIIGVYMHGCANSVPLPAPLEKYNYGVIGWNSMEKLGSMIEGTASYRENSDGTQRGAAYDVSYVKC
jgi:hypothetical protein